MKCQLHLKFHAHHYQTNGYQQLAVKKTVSPAQLRNIDFRLHKVDKCKSTIPEPKRIKLSAKSQYPNLMEPSEGDKEEFF